VGSILDVSDTITIASDQEGEKTNPTLVCSINSVNSWRDEGKLP
jgi:hypothetical protein